MTVRPSTAPRSQKSTGKPKRPDAASATRPARRAADPGSGGTGRTTTTMSLYAADLDRLKKIRRKLEDNGIKRVSDSEAVRVALRHVKLGADKLLATYRAMQADDRRRKQGKVGDAGATR